MLDFRYKDRTTEPIAGFSIQDVVSMIDGNNWRENGEMKVQ